MTELKLIVAGNYRHARLFFKMIIQLFKVVGIPANVIYRGDEHIITVGKWKVHIISGSENILKYRYKAIMED